MRCIACDNLIIDMSQIDDELCGYCVSIAILAAEELNNDEE